MWNLANWKLVKKSKRKADDIFFYFWKFPLFKKSLLCTAVWCFIHTIGIFKWASSVEMSVHSCQTFYQLFFFFFFANFLPVWWVGAPSCTFKHSHIHWSRAQVLYYYIHMYALTHTQRLWWDTYIARGRAISFFFFSFLVVENMETSEERE